MRISDWSSDVCSSDLASWCHPGVVLLYAAGDSHPAGLPQLGWKLLDRFLRSGWAPTGWGRTGWLNPSPPAYPRGFAWYQESQLHDTRSEEHTSELQSLMRISYAVFCLKKKKKKQQQNM